MKEQVEKQAEKEYEKENLEHKQAMNGAYERLRKNRRDDKKLLSNCGFISLMRNRRRF